MCGVVVYEGGPGDGVGEWKGGEGGGDDEWCVAGQGGREVVRLLWRGSTVEGWGGRGVFIDGHGIGIERVGVLRGHGFGSLSNGLEASTP